MKTVRNVGRSHAVHDKRFETFAKSCSRFKDERTTENVSNIEKKPQQEIQQVILFWVKSV